MPSTGGPTAGRLLARKPAVSACARLLHRIPLRAWRFTAPTSRTRQSVGNRTAAEAAGCPAVVDWRRPAALPATTAPTPRARLPAGLRRHHATQRGQKRLSSIVRIRGCRLIPATRMEAGQLARRRMDATRAARRCRPRRSAPPDHVIRRGRASCR